ncbi:Multifunctional 2-oxoglutarate metabolism enzyme [Planctomycetes bacterium Poly30]|uniref:oxoglutarate dehydrogenase (succinyl-transferring) n=1 Tax=Saltatorellus ferox TaxID=2528018 RepID=A0A518ES14_9BACT|nr:Multifunctional 2-oxoglutarate metabolism enzyme [Planctomycetes bacterium Poly30]
MPIDFEQEYGVNAGYVQELFDDWKADPAQVAESWQKIFERAGKSSGSDQAGKGSDSASASGSAGDAAAPKAASAPEFDASADPELEPLIGIAGRIATNMEASLEIPVATSVRTLSAKIMSENRGVINEHMLVRAFGKASYTHLVAFALARALGENKRVQSSYVEGGGKRYRRVPTHVNLGLAIDVPGPKGRMLVVPNIKAAETLDFAAFYRAYQDIVDRGRDGKLTSEDFAHTTCTLTNPGGFGTVMSVPRLMPGQGIIVATGSIGVPPELGGMSKVALAQSAIGPVMTMTSTYDHRVIQGAESGLLLKRVDELLMGADGFYDEIFEALRVPWTPARAGSDMRPPSGEDAGEVQAKIWKLIQAYRSRGGQLADLDPLGYRPELLESLDPSSYGLTVWDLDRTFLCGGMNGREKMTLREILKTLRRAYCRRWTSEVSHITSRDRKLWLRDRIENEEHFEEFGQEERMEILTRLNRAQNFEQFLANTYVGNKRFSLEGGDTMIPALADIIERASLRGVEKVVIGMAHRGRLNVLANLMGKSHEQIFREFEGGLLPLSTEGSGDVKYHLGQRGVFRTRDGKEVAIELSANPSHLEAVDPVVCGMTRAYQDAIGDTDRTKVLAVLIHGDAAFSGQGVVMETLNMSGLRAFTNGGTVHLIVNNQIGFTAGPRDLRSTHYCSDTAKAIEAPIMHANGDFPESVLRACRLAVDYQAEFGADAVVDMVCYRRWGHNEGDEPAYTQPALYSRIAKHPTVCESYSDLLIRRGAITREVAEAVAAETEAELREAMANHKAAEQEELPLEEIVDMHLDDERDYVRSISPETGVSAEKLVEIIDELNRMPEGFVVHPNLLRQLRRRESMVRGEQDVDWGCAEALAFATLLQEGVPIRLEGQDSGRGTFSHRHAVIRDQATDKEHVPLRALTDGKVKFEAWDSLLSEEAAVGFEYGYSLVRKDALVLWEGQFGDFANGAQIPIDQFVVSGEAKWRQLSGLMMLLPHGYDGQGPEHSSARLERFLVACSGGNLTVVNCTTSAQAFHLYRRQGLSEVKRPVIVMTPKSYLRDKRAASPIADMASGRFLETILGGGTDKKKVTRLVLCTGKFAHELETARVEKGADHVAILRVEQLYPFPKDQVKEAIASFPKLKQLIWSQEEPRNMGAWAFIMQRFSDLGVAIQYAGRAESSSPATGSYRRHGAEQDFVLKMSLGEVEPKIIVG